MKRLLLPVGLALLAGFGLAPRASAQVALPKLEARVTDLTGTLTAAQQTALTEKLQAFEARKGAQVVVLMLPTTAPEEIEQFGIRLADAWKIGREGPDDGAILIVAKDDRAMRIEVGRGLEGALTDVISVRIIDETITPLFKQGDFYGGINAGLDQMLRVVDGEQLPAPDRSWKPSDGEGPWGMVIALVFIVTSFFGARAGRLPFALIFGALVGGFTWLSTSRISTAIGAFIAVFILVLVTGSGNRGGRRGGRAYRDGGFGGFGGGFGGGSGGGGGFGGGGGSFGGGGASGRW